MSEPIRILIVEDMPTDADLAMREIRKSLAGCLFQRVETEPDYLDALENFKPDLILSDYHLPHFNGMEALKLALERAPLTPLVIFTGTLSEDTAVDCMKAGAANYIIKENIKRLGVAVVHALDENKVRVERDQAEKDLRESEKRFRTALQDVPTIAVQGYAMDGTTHYWNSASERLYGYSAQEAIGRNLLDLIIPAEMQSGVRQAIQQMAETGQPIPAAELSLMRKDGSRVTVFSSHSIVPSIDGAPELFCLDVDLTDRKRAEHIIQMRNEDLALVNALNEAVNRGENIDRIVEVFAREVEGMIPACRGAAVYLLDADTSHLELKSLTFSDSLIKKIEKLVGYTIPQIKFPIQKDGYFQKMLAAEQGSILGDPKTIQQWMSEFGEAISVPPLVRDGFKRFIPRIYEILKIHSVLTVRLTSSGNIIGLLEVAGESQFSEEDLNRIQNISGQVTEVILRRQAEDDLRHAEEKYRNIFENSLEGIFQSTPAGRYLTVNPALARMWGYDSPEDLIASVTDIAHQIYISPEVRAEHMRFIKEHDGDLAGFEYQAQCKDGSVIWVSESVHSVRGADGGLLYFEGVVEDISSRKQAEATILESERQMRALVTSLDDIVFEVDERGIYLNVWTANESLLARPKAQMLGRGIMEVMGEENGRPFAEAVQRVLASGHSESIEYPLEVMGGPRWFVAQISPILNQNNSHRTVSILVRDISGRKQAEEQIQLQLRRLRALSEIDRAISSSLDMRLSLDILLSETLSQLNVDAASVLLLNSTSQSLEYIAGKGFRTPAIRQTRIRLGEGLPGRVGLERKVVHIPDLAGAGKQFKRAELLKDEQFVEYFGVPLIAKGTLKGVLEVFHRSSLDPDLEWENYLETLGGQAAIAIDSAQLFDGLQQSNMELITAYDATIAGWSHAMDLRDKETEGHTLRVTDLTLKLAERMGTDPKELMHIRRGALLHDIGKLGVPDHILHKPGPLTEEEWVIMRQHPAYAKDMLLPINYLRPALDIPFCHHEKWDGSGYPRKLSGEQIPLAARLFAVVDVWDALCSDRPYREKWSVERTRDYIFEQSGKHFDPRVVEIFLNMIETE